MKPALTRYRVLAYLTGVLLLLLTLHVSVRYGQSRAENRISHRIVINHEVAEQSPTRFNGIDEAGETSPGEGIEGEENDHNPGGANGEGQKAPWEREGPGAAQ